MRDLYSIEFQDEKNNTKTLNDYKDKVILIINSATKCGFTSQYEDLENLFRKYKDKGFVILDFPCNQFLFQSPGSIEEIHQFCQLNYQTSFPLFNKVKVNGLKAHPLFKALKELSPNELQPNQTNYQKSKKTSKRIKWNFTKFLIDKNGQVVYRFAPSFLPEKIDPFIKELLSTK